MDGSAVVPRRPAGSASAPPRSGATEEAAICPAKAKEEFSRNSLNSFRGREKARRDAPGGVAKENRFHMPVLMNHRRRLRALRGQMKRQQIAALLVTHPADVRYLCGFTGSNAVLAITAN